MGGKPVERRGAVTPLRSRERGWSVGSGSWSVGLLAGIAGAAAVECLFEIDSGGVELLSGLNPWLPHGVAGLVGVILTCIVICRANARDLNDRPSLQLDDLIWTRNDFCRGWYISGATGSGKTEAIKLLMHQLCRAEPDWGGLFIDEKGFFIDEVLPILRTYGRGDDIKELRTRPEGASPEWVPPFRFNVLGDARVRTSQYVEAILMVTEAIASGNDDKGFFRTQAGLHIGAAIDLYRGLREWQQQVGAPKETWVAPTLRGVYEILTSEDEFQLLLQERTGLYVEVFDDDRASGNTALEEKKLVPEFRGMMPAVLLQALDHFNKRYWHVRAQEQMEGIKGTITNYLRWFTDEAVHEVFGAEQANFTMSCMDEGKMICVSLPQRYAIERRYLCALLKVLAYAHARARTPTKKTYNAMVIWQDEAQRFIMPVDGDVDILRQFHVTTVISAQFRAQLEKALGGKENAQPIIGNLRNRIILQAADEECAEESAKFIGKGLRKKRSYTRQAGGQRSSSYSDEVAYSVEPYQLRQLPKFVAVVCHAGGTHRILQFTPLDQNARVPGWFRALALPAMKWKLAWGARGPKYCRFVPPKVYVR